MSSTVLAGGSHVAVPSHASVEHTGGETDILGDVCIGLWKFSIDKSPIKQLS